MSYQQLIKKYFDSLVNQFITDSKHKDTTIVFKQYIKGSSHNDTLGNTEGDHNWTKQETSPGSGIYKKVPGSDVYKYTISFLNHYKDDDQLCGTVVHKFSHLWLYSKSDNSHDHDDTFYSKMDQFENWLDRRYGLSPRQDKIGNWNQHVDPNKHEERQKEQCKGCGETRKLRSVSHCPQCYQKKESEIEEADDFNRLTDLLKSS